MVKLKLLVLFLGLLLNTNGNAQTTGVPDTLTYLQSIVANKAQFIGQSFSVLRDSLKIQIKHFSPFASIHYRINDETSTMFSFYFPLNVEEKYLTYSCLEILWQTPLNANQSRALYSQFNGGRWNSKIASFYSSGIIADIKVIQLNV